MKENEVKTYIDMFCILVAKSADCLLKSRSMINDMGTPKSLNTSGIRYRDDRSMEEKLQPVLDLEKESERYAEQARQVRKVLNWESLTGYEYDIVIARHMARMTVQDIADNEGYTKQTISYQLKRAYKKLGD